MHTLPQSRRTKKRQTTTTKIDSKFKRKYTISDNKMSHSGNHIGW